MTGTARRGRARAGLSDRQVADLTVWALVVASAMGGAFASTTVTGFAGLDALYRATYAAAVCLVAASSRRWTWLVLAGVATVGALAQPLALALAAAALVIAVAAATAARRHRRAGALVGLLSAQALLHLEAWGPLGAPTLLALLAPIPCAVSAWRLLESPVRARWRRRTSWALLGLAVIAIGGLVSFAQAQPEASRGGDRVRAGVAALNRGDPAEAERELRMASAAFARSREAATSPLAVASRALPLVDLHLDALAESADVGAQLTTVAADAATDTDYGSIRVTDGVVDTDRFAELRAPLERVASELEHASGALATIDTSALLPPAADAIDALRSRVDDAIPAAHDAITGTELAPGMLGADGQRRWLIGFTTPAEARGLGGFLGYWTEITAQDGRLEITDSGRVPDLVDDPAEPLTLEAPEDYQRRYGRLHPEEHPQDATFSPDFPSVAGVFEHLYTQSTGRSVDGMILLDPIALGELLRITGPITVDGVRLDHDNAAEFLLRTQYATYDDREARGDALDTVAREAFDRLLTDRLDDPARLLRIMGPMAAQRRVMAHSVHADEQALFAAIGLDGAFPPAEPGLDLLAVTNQNAGNNKLDAYLRREVRYEPHLDPADGTVTATVTITLHNDAVTDDLPLYVTRNRADSGQPPGVNWTWLSVHTPLLLQSATVDGNAEQVEPQRELGWNAYALHVAVPAGGSVEVVVQLDGGLDLASGYRFRYQSQALVAADQLTVRPTVPDGWRQPEPSELVTEADEPVNARWDLEPD